MYGAKQEIKIINESEKTIYVTVYYPRSVTGVDPGRCAAYHVDDDATDPKLLRKTP